MVDYDASTLPAALADAHPGDTLTIATGTHTFASALTVPDGVNLIGHGIDVTTLRFPTVPSSADLYGLVYSGDAANALTDLSIEGPATSNVSGKFSFGIYIGGTAAASVGSITLTRVKVTRPAASAAIAGFYRAIMSIGGAVTDTGPLTLTITDCDLSAGNGVLNMYCDPNVTNKTLTVTGTTLHTTGTSHLAYVHPGISMSWTDCTFADCPNYAVQHFSASSNVAARYARFRNCTFAANLTHGVLTSDRAGALTEFDGCTFNNTAASNAAITARTSVRVWTSNFVLGAAANGIQGVDTGTIDVLGCTFSSNGAGGGAAIACTAGTTRVHSCTFDLHSTGTTAPKGVWCVGGTATVDYCHFGAKLNAPPATDAPYAVYVGAGGHATIRNSRLTGYYIPVYAAMHLDHASGTLDVDYTTFLIGAGLRPLYQTPGGTAGNAIWGTHNTLGAGVLSPSLVA